MERDHRWKAFREFVVEKQSPIRPDVCVIGGGNWRLPARYLLALSIMPVIHLDQHSSTRIQSFGSRNSCGEKQFGLC